MNSGIPGNSGSLAAILSDSEAGDDEDIIDVLDDDIDATPDATSNLYSNKII